MGFRKVCSAAAAALVIAAGGAVVAPARAETVTHGCIDSVPEPDSDAPVQICYSLFRPDGADPAHPVPLILHSHGWGGSRSSEPGSFHDWMEAGFGVLSFDQRGFGESGGQAHVEHPDFEGQDVQRLVDMVSTLDWVAEEAPDDPVLAAIGGSYGGGYQFVGAFTELRDRGATRFDALAPEITWWDLKESLAPDQVPRSLWVTALYAAGAQAHTATVHKGFAYGAATGNWADGSVLPDSDLNAFFEKNGPAWHVGNGRVLDIPVVFGQGINDNLFNLNQGLKNFANALTPAARAKSIFVGYNGGHALPSLLPQGTGGDGDPCSQRLGGGSFGDLSIRFFREALKGESTGLGGHGLFHLATPDGACQTTSTITTDRSVDLGQVVTLSGPAPVPVATRVVDGPVTVTGIPYVDAKVTTLVPDTRAFFALSVGTSPLDARIVQDNMLPLREVEPVSGAARTIELPAISVDVPAGQSLFLTVSPFSDMSFGHGSRVPGAVVLDDVVVRFPTRRDAAPAVLGVTAERNAPAPAPAPSAGAAGGDTLPATGGGTSLAAAGAALAAVALVLRRRLS